MKIHEITEVKIEAGDFVVKHSKERPNSAPYIEQVIQHEKIHRVYDFCFIKVATIQNPVMTEYEAEFIKVIKL